MTGDPRDVGADDDMTYAAAAITAAIDGAEPVEAPPLDGDLATEWQTDLGNARRLVARHARDLRYVREIGWLAWDGKRWREDPGEPLRRAHQTAEAMTTEALEIKAAGPRQGEAAEAHDARWKMHYAWAVSSSNLGRASSMINSAEPYMALDREDLDQHPMRLNVANGTLHLGEMRADGYVPVQCMPHRRSDYATLLADVSYDRAARAPRWERFVAEVMPDARTRGWVQRWLGYCLTGDTSEQCVAIFEGKGANGKSTMVDVVARMLGSYAATTPIETFLHNERRSGSGPSPDLARLPGVRMVRTSEPEPGARLSESVVKQWTGGERFAARHLHKGFFEFKPAGKLTMSVNIRPVIVGKDHGIRRRIHLVPFRQQFPRTPGLVETLLAERAGVLNWLLDGYRAWREDGIGTAPEIAEATRGYFDEMDPIGSFVADCCDTGGQLSDFQSDITAAYQRWCIQMSEDPKNPTMFGRRLSDMGFGKAKSNGLTKRVGLKVREEWRGSGASVPSRGRQEDDA